MFVEGGWRKIAQNLFCVRLSRLCFTKKRWKSYVHRPTNTPVESTIGVSSDYRTYRLCSRHCFLLLYIRKYHISYGMLYFVLVVFLHSKTCKYYVFFGFWGNLRDERAARIIFSVMLLPLEQKTSFDTDIILYP
jgi:hypothetical protein